MKKILFSILIMIAASASAQTTTIYKTDTINNVYFGSATDVYGRRIDLYCNIVQPNNPNPHGVIFVAHGGGEFTGDKGNAGGTAGCWNYQATRLGLTIIYYNYRLANPWDFFGPTATIERCNQLMNEQLYRAIQDGFACARFACNDENKLKYNINPKYCFFGGISAGALNSLMMVEWQPVEYGSLIDTTKWVNKSNAGVPFRIAGALSLSGAILSSCEIDPTDVPIMCVQGLLDRTLKVDGGSNHKVKYTGIYDVVAQSEYYDNPVYTLYFPNAGHTLKGLTPEETKANQTAIKLFFYKYLKFYLP